MCFNRVLRNRVIYSLKLTYLNKFANFYRNQTGNVITRDELDNQISIIIKKIETATEICNYLKKITIKAIDSQMYYMKTGQLKHGITKEDYKNAIDVLTKIAEKDMKSEQEKTFLKFCVEFIKKSIDNS